jgi:hypothetical protein
MKKIVQLVVVFICLLLTNIIEAQNVFPDKFDGCITDRFGLEKDSIEARIDSKYLVNTVLSGVDEKYKSKLNGILKLQIIVNTDGKSCLISIENNTNIKTSKLNLKKTIDDNLIWNINQKNKVSPLIILKFNSNSVQLKRIGVSGDFGMKEIFNDEVLKD